MQIQTHPGVQDPPQDGPLQPEDEECSFHCRSGHHQRQPHAGPLRYLRWTNPAGSNARFRPAPLFLSIFFFCKDLKALGKFYVAATSIN